jgi:putative tryptophan/tyrosine transport system substrate-binding protein
MNRRSTLQALFAIGATLPLAAIAQSRMPFRIGVPTRLTPDGAARLKKAFAVHDWHEKRDYVLLDGEFQYGDRIEESVTRMLAKRPDVALVTATAYAAIAHRLTKKIPIVMFSSGYPVEAGVADSLSRPGRNVTGNALYAGLGIWGKLIELLRDANPRTRRVGVLWTYVPPVFAAEEIAPLAPELARAADRLGIAVHRIDVAKAEGMDAALAALSNQGVDALLLTLGPSLFPVRQKVLEYAMKRRWPTIVDFAFPPEDRTRRPLLTYAPSWDELRRQAVEYIVRILRDDEKPADLPIRQPAKFELVLDLRSAQQIGLTIPHSLLLRADRVIE